MTTVAKMTDGRFVQIVRVVSNVAFSDAIGWILVCFDFDVIERRRMIFKWVPASTKFWWIKSFLDCEEAS